MTRTILSLAILTTLLGSAHADAPYSADEQEREATTIAVGGTLVGYTLMVTPLFIDMNDDIFDKFEIGGEAIASFGPSLGHFYAGETEHGVVFTGLRAAGFVAFDVGLIGAERSSSRAASSALAGLAITGAATAIGLGIYDCIDAHRAQRRTNERAANLALAPLVGHQRSMNGLALVGSF